MCAARSCRPDAAGRLRIDALTAAGLRIGRFTADIAGNAGQLRLDGEVTGLHVPGPNADLLASDPLTIQADARLDAPDRPVHVALRHRLFTADADALTGERRRVDASLRLADLAPFAAMGQVPIAGQPGAGPARGDRRRHHHAHRRWHGRGHRRAAAGQRAGRRRWPAAAWPRRCTAMI